MNKIIIKVEGMVCEGCEKRVENIVKEIKNVKKVKASHIKNIIEIEYKDKIDMEEVKSSIEKIGFKVKE